MQPHELIRAAAQIIDTGGWSQGEHARDINGDAVPLYGSTGGDTSRASINPKAAAFSMYGALAKAIAVAGAPSHVGLMWVTLDGLARDAIEEASGGTNHVHPVIAYNETEGRTKAEVLAFMERCAAEIEAAVAVRAG